MTESKQLSVTIYLPDLSGGGAERLHARLLPEFVDAGMNVTFLLDREGGELMQPVRDLGARIVSLGADRQIKALPRLVSYLKREKPDVLISNMEHMNIMSVLARRLAFSKTRIIVTQHNTFSKQVERPSWQFRVLPFLYRKLLTHADKIIAVSQGVADDLAVSAGIDPSRIDVIYNGVVTDDFDRRASEPAGDQALFDGPPVVLAMGRFVEQKDFATLVRAFADVSAQSDARLIILGEGPLRAQLEALVLSLGLGDRVSLPGFKENSLAYLKNARLFVLSSQFEGFGNVVAEALACGTAVVSTDCPHGPAEILDHGRFGALVPVGDATRLGEAIFKALREPVDTAALMARGHFFTVKRCAQAYSEVFA